MVFAMNDENFDDDHTLNLEEQLVRLVYDWAVSYDWVEKDEIFAAMINTNSLFQDPHIDRVRILDMKEDAAEFSLRGTLSDQEQEDSSEHCIVIEFEAEGVIADQEGFDVWEVTSASIESVTVLNKAKVDDWSSTRHSYCDNVNDLFTKISSFANEWWWRGHGRDDWELKPSIARQGKPSLSLETSLLLKFENQSTFLSSSSHRPGIENVRFTMQHHGLPTRLLDWSNSPLTALYFAMCDKKHDSSNACLWVLDPRQLNKHHKEKFPYVLGGQHDKMFTESDDKILAIHAPYINLRMKMQQSEFTVHTHYAALENQLGAALFLKEKIVIPSQLKAEIRKRLAALGVTRSTLFPDLDSIARTIKEDFLE